MNVICFLCVTADENHNGTLINCLLLYFYIIKNIIIYIITTIIIQNINELYKLSLFFTI